MTQEPDKKADFEYCPNCQMPLEDVEACNYCEWKRNKKIREVE